MSHRSRSISTAAYTPPTDPPQAIVLATGETATPQFAQAARRHIFCSGNTGPVAVVRIQTPEGHPQVICYANPDFTHEAPQPPASALPPRLRPYTPDDPPPVPLLHVPAPADPAAAAPPTRTRGPGEPGRRAQALQSPALRGRYGKVSDSPNTAAGLRRRFPEAEVTTVSSGPYAGVFMRFPGTPDLDAALPDYIQDPPRRKARPRKGAEGQPGPYEVCPPKKGFLHLFLRRDTPAWCIPDKILHQAVLNGDVPPNGPRVIPFDYMGTERDRYVPIPQDAYEDPRLTALAASEGYFIVFRPDNEREALALSAAARPLRVRPLPARITSARRIPN